MFFAVLSYLGAVVFHSYFNQFCDETIVNSMPRNFTLDRNLYICAWASYMKKSHVSKRKNITAFEISKRQIK